MLSFKKEVFCNFILKSRRRNGRILLRKILRYGELAKLGSRLTGSQEIRSSNLLFSTMNFEVPKVQTFGISFLEAERNKILGYMKAIGVKYQYIDKPYGFGGAPG